MTRRILRVAGCANQFPSIDLALLVYDYLAHSKYPPSLAGLLPEDMAAVCLICQEVTPFHRSSDRSYRYVLKKPEQDARAGKRKETDCLGMPKLAKASDL